MKNYLISHQPYRWIGKSIRNLFFPYKTKTLDASELFVELASVCNAKCVFCNYRFGYRAKMQMDMSNFEKIIQNAIKIGYKRLNLTSMGGELFIHREAVDAIELAKEYGFEIIEVYTNGILLHSLDIERLLKSGITTLKISFPSFDRESYKVIYGVDRFAEFDKSLTMLLDIHKNIKSEVKIFLEPRSIASLSQLMNTVYFKNKVAPYLSEYLHINNPIVRYDNWGGDIKQNMLPSGMRVDISPIKKLPFRRANLCSMLVNFGILVNGDVRLCNCRYDETIGTEKDELFIDNIYKYESLSSMLKANEFKIKTIRDNFINGNMPDLCRKCTFYLPLKLVDKEQK